jgi:hypothetical protein
MNNPHKPFVQHVHDTVEESEQQIEHGMTVDAQEALRSWREKRNAQRTLDRAG